MAAMETLSKLFGSEIKVKIMRMFLFGPDTVFHGKDIAARVHSTPEKIRRETALLERSGLIKRKNGGFILNQGFVYLKPLQNFLINTEPLQPKELTRRISKLGSVKLLITSGVFIQDGESRADLLVVGDNIKKTALENTIRNLESEIGKELRYAFFPTEDFKYRLNMYDKLVRDILDYPHKKIVNKLGIV